MRDFIDPPRGTMDTVVIVALANVGPVTHKDTAVGTVEQLDAAEPSVARGQEVGLMLPYVASSAALNGVPIHPSPMEVQGEGLTAVLCRPIVT